MDEGNEHANEIEDGRAQHPAEHGVIDPIIFGRRLRAARIMSGYDKVDDMVVALKTLTGLSISARTLYAIERGEQLANVDQAVAFIITLRTEGGFRYFVPAMHGHFGKEYERLSGWS